MDKVEELLTRGVANIISSKEELIGLLKSGKKLNIYMGIDPTAVNIHLGHAVALRKLRDFANLGHNVTFLVGDFTALVGDTSDKETERPQLTSEQIQENLKTYKEQASKILDFSKISVKFNSEWLKELKFEDIVMLTKHFSLNDFISRELIKKRLNSGASVSLLETLYPLMQGYDSYHLDTDLQIGGTDQTFNMQAGRTLVKDNLGKSSYVLTMNFLTGTDGRKMSKTWGNAIWLTDTSNEMFGKIMSIKDELIPEYFTLATDVPLSRVSEIEKELKNGQNPMEIKKKLALTIVSQFFDENEAKIAEDNFKKTVQDKEIPENIATVKVVNNEPLSKVVLEKGLVSSMSEWKRLIEQYGVSYNDEKITNPFITTKELESGGVLKLGKRVFLKIEK
jgi:tyrosyl-tRNA synthetase